MSKRTCSLEGCDNEHDARGLCHHHYAQAKKTGTLDAHARERQPGGTCRLDGCDQRSKALGLCRAHYTRQRTTGSFELRKVGRVAGPGEKVCSVESCDYVVKTRGYCSKHYQRLYNSGQLAKTETWRIVVAPAPLPAIFGSQVLPPNFWARVRIDPGDCWYWTGAHRDNGYGIFTAIRPDGVKKIQAVHRVAYLAFRGAIPDGLTLDHLCHTDDDFCYAADQCPHRRCCNPDHLEVVTQRVNSQRAHHLHKATCPAGHPYEPPHLAYDRDGYPDCRTCRNRRWRERYHARRAAGLPPRGRKSAG